MLNRMRALAPALVLAIVLFPADAPAQSAVDGVRATIAALIAKSGAEVAVVWRPLDATASQADALRINADIRFHAASTMKIPVMIELFRQAGAGRLRLDDSIIVTNRFASIVDGSPYELSATEDSDGDVYKAIGHPMTYRALCEAMITTSSNLSTNILIDRLDPAAVRRTMIGLGAAGIDVLRGVEDQKAFDKGLNNTTTAEALAVLLWKLGRGEAVSPEASASMVEIMARQRFRAGLPAGVPGDVRIAHKTGSITRIRHDAGIVFAARPYVLVVLTRGLDDGATADALIAAISRAVYDGLRGRH
jgi:beta-lactamase class A